MLYVIMLLIIVVPMDLTETSMVGPRPNRQWEERLQMGAHL